MPYRPDPRPEGITEPNVPIPVDLSPWRAGRVVCIDGRAWLQVARCELTDRVHLPATVERPAVVDCPQLELVMDRLGWVTPRSAPKGALLIQSQDLLASLVVNGQVWRVMERDWVCSTLAAAPHVDIVDTLTRLTLVLWREWWNDATPNPETAVRSPEQPC